MQKEFYLTDFRAAAARLRAPEQSFELLATTLAEKYGLNNVVGLTQLLRDIERAREAPMPAERVLPETEEINSHWKAMQVHAKAIVAINPLYHNEGLAHAALRIRSPQWCYGVVEAVHMIADTPARTHVLTPHSAQLRALIFPLLYFVVHEGDMSSEGIVETSAGLLPARGSPAEFATDALAIAGWDFTQEDIAVEYDHAWRAVYAQLTSEEGSVPLHDDDESAADTGPLRETGHFEHLLHSYFAHDVRE